MDLTRDRCRPDYRPPEPLIDWHEQDWLLILKALDRHALDGHLTEGEELRAYQLVESIARMHGLVRLMPFDVAMSDTFNNIPYTNHHRSVKTKSR